MNFTDQEEAVRILRALIQAATITTAEFGWAQFNAEQDKEEARIAIVPSGNINAARRFLERIGA